MIHDLSTTLRNILNQNGSALADITIAFDRPTTQFQPRQSTINLFLFDIRENAELRDYEPTVERSNGQAMIRRPPMRVDCSYLVTAWAVTGVEEALLEHSLLGQVLQVFTRYPTIPADLLQGSLKPTSKDALPVPLSVAVPNPTRQSTEFWASLGIPVRASLIVTATIALDLNDPEQKPEHLVRNHVIAFQAMDAGSSLEQRFEINGRISSTDGIPLRQAQVTLLERHQATQTDSTGLYQFSGLPAGTYTLQVRQPDKPIETFPLNVPARNAQSSDVQLNA